MRLPPQMDWFVFVMVLLTGQCARSINPIKQWKRFIEKLFHKVFEEREPPDTTTGDANPRACFSQRNLAKEKYYPKGIAFLQKKPLEVRWKNGVRRSCECGDLVKPTR